jgi:hypothetical protein
MGHLGGMGCQKMIKGSGIAHTSRAWSCPRHGHISEWFEYPCASEAHRLFLRHLTCPLELKPRTLNKEKDHHPCHSYLSANLMWGFTTRVKSSLKKVRSELCCISQDSVFYYKNPYIPKEIYKILGDASLKIVSISLGRSLLNRRFSDILQDWGSCDLRSNRSGPMETIC